MFFEIGLSVTFYTTYAIDHPLHARFPEDKVLSNSNMGKREYKLKREEEPSSPDGDVGDDISLEDGEVASEDEAASDGEITGDGGMVVDNAWKANDGAIENMQVGPNGGDDMERQIVDGMEEGEVTANDERAAIDLQVQKDLQHASTSVQQKDARYFTGGDLVVCSICGVKGHMSYMCEEADDRRCFACGNKGHTSSKCAYQTPRRPRCGVRKVGLPREPVLKCYVCHGDGHLDCSVNRWRGVLSCYNCGLRGHSGGNCNLPPADSILQICRDLLERDRFTKRDKSVRPRIAGSKISKENRKTRESTEFRELLFAKLRHRRFNR